MLFLALVGKGANQSEFCKVSVLIEGWCVGFEKALMFSSAWPYAYAYFFLRDILTPLDNKIQTMWAVQRVTKSKWKKKRKENRKIKLHENDLRNIATRIKSKRNVIKEEAGKWKRSQMWCWIAAPTKVVWLVRVRNTYLNTWFEYTVWIANHDLWCLPSSMVKRGNFDFSTAFPYDIHLFSLSHHFIWLYYQCDDQKKKNGDIDRNVEKMQQSWKKILENASNVERYSFHIWTRIYSHAKDHHE